MSISYRSMIFTMLGQKDMTTVQRSVATILVLRGSGARHAGPWKPIPWSRIATLTGFSPDQCQHAFQALCAKGWFEIQTRPGDGQERYAVPEYRVAQALIYRDEHRAKQQVKEGVPA